MQQETKNEGLQAARAIAALSVAYFHSYIALRSYPEAAQIPIAPLKNWGYLGVNFFFAISGYVICIVASKSNFVPGGFAMNRVFRLFPMYWATMLVIATMIAFGKYRSEPLGHFLYSMTLLPQPGVSAYDVSWTLEREMVFYAIVACTVPLVGVRGLAAVLAMLAMAGWYFGNPWSYHIVSTTQADFLAGVLIFLGRNQIKRVGAVAPIVAGCACLAYTRSHDFLFSVPLSMASILIGMTHLRLPWHRRPFSLIVAVGNASYSIYLLHYIFFYYAMVVSAKSWLHPAWLCEPWRYGTIAACCVVSYQTWRFIELPALRLGHSIFVRRVADAQRPSGPAIKTV